MNYKKFCNCMNKALRKNCLGKDVQKCEEEKQGGRERGREKKERH